MFRRNFLKFEEELQGQDRESYVRIEEAGPLASATV
jgi:hypothetical protein